MGCGIYVPVRKRLILISAVRLKRGLPSPPLHSFPSPRPISSPVAWVCVSLVTHRGPSPATWSTNDPNLLCVTLLEAVVFYNFVQGETRRDLWAVKKFFFFFLSSSFKLLYIVGVCMNPNIRSWRLVSEYRQTGGDANTCDRRDSTISLHLGLLMLPSFPHSGSNWQVLVPRTHARTHTQITGIKHKNNHTPSVALRLLCHSSSLSSFFSYISLQHFLLSVWLEEQLCCWPWQMCCIAVSLHEKRKKKEKRKTRLVLHVCSLFSATEVLAPLHWFTHMLSHSVALRMSLHVNSRMQMSTFFHKEPANRMEHIVQLCVCVYARTRMGPSGRADERVVTGVLTC